MIWQQISDSDDCSDSLPKLNKNFNWEHCECSNRKITNIQDISTLSTEKPNLIFSLDGVKAVNSYSFFLILWKQLLEEHS